MVSPAAIPHSFLSKHRLEALSDGLFGVVMTLLVLELKLEHLPSHPSNAEVGHALLPLLRPLFGYAVAFLMAAALWVLQHRAFSLLAHTSLRHTWLTLAFFFPITLMPFTVTAYVQAISNGTLILLFFGNLTAAAALLFVGWMDAQKSQLLLPNADPAAVHSLGVRIGALALGFLASGIIGFFQPAFTSLGLIVVLLVSRRLARRPLPPA